MIHYNVRGRVHIPTRTVKLKREGLVKRFSSRQRRTMNIMWVCVVLYLCRCVSERLLVSGGFLQNNVLDVIVLRGRVSHGVQPRDDTLSGATDGAHSLSRYLTGNTRPAALNEQSDQRDYESHSKAHLKCHHHVVARPPRT
ncbi:unnamed protein product [Timema podura]|uniref:Uncharacterized protein n=1 Tax=Timema podura TaxID=61482 RepID=A0ABN7PJU5_TIMPD|nr:unnamed protein product [Timema podura]